MRAPSVRPSVRPSVDRLLQASLIFASLLAACGDDDGGANQNNQNGNEAEPVCGNGALELGEQCDEGAANSDTVPGACRTSCRTAHCGDSVIDASELCDGAALGGEDCVSQGFTAGGLTCTAD
jgi:hypothetical protein